MKGMMKRLALAMLVLVMVSSVMLPAAMAAEYVSNTNYGSATIYAGTSATLGLQRGGVRQSNTLYKWKSNKTSVVSVTSGGVITGKKAGTAIVSATRKSNSRDVVKFTVTVRRNKVDYINAKPSVSSVKAGCYGWRLKSVEIVSPSKVVMELYFVSNRSGYTTTRLNSIQEGVAIYNRYTGKYVKTIAYGRSYSISGFKAKKGRFVQTIKVTLTGSQTNCANICLSDYKMLISTNGSVKVTGHK